MFGLKGLLRLVVVARGLVQILRRAFFYRGAISLCSISPRAMQTCVWGVALNNPMRRPHKAMQALHRRLETTAVRTAWRAKHSQVLK